MKKIYTLLLLFAATLIILLFGLSLFNDGQVIQHSDAFNSHIYLLDGELKVNTFDNSHFYFETRNTSKMIIFETKQSVFDITFQLDHFNQLDGYDAYIFYPTNHCEFSVFYDGEELFTRKYRTKEDGPHLFYEGLCQNFIKLPANYYEKPITFHFDYKSSPVSYFKLREAYIGNETVVRQKALSIGFMPLFFGGLIGLLGLFTLILAFVNLKSKNNSLFSISLFTINIGLWLFTQSLSRFVIFDNSAFFSICGYFAIYGLPMSTVFVIKNYYLKQETKAFKIFEYLAVGCLELLAIVFFADLLTYKIEAEATLVPIGLFVLLFELSIISYLVYLRFKKKQVALNSIIIALTFISLAILTDELLLVLKITITSPLLVFMLYLPYLLAIIVLVKDIIRIFIKEQKKANTKEILYDIYSTDNLSKGFTRNYFDTRLANKTLKLENHTLVLFIDIDNMKIINDTKGHAVGDELIATVGKAVNTLFFDSQNKPLFVRYGGDEFLLIINDKNSKINDVNSIIERLQDTFSMLSKGLYSITIGYAYTQKGVSLSETINEADKRLLFAKKERRAQRN